MISVNMTEWARTQGIYVTTAYRWYREGKLPVPARKTGRLILVCPDAVGSWMNGTRPRARRLLADPAVTVVVEHRDRLGRMDSELAGAALAAVAGRGWWCWMTPRPPVTWCGT